MARGTQKQGTIKKKKLVSRQCSKYKVPLEYSTFLSFGQTREPDGFLLVSASTIYQGFEASQSPIQYNIDSKFEDAI